MMDYKKEPMFKHGPGGTFPGFIPEGQEWKHPAMGQGDKMRGYIPDVEIVAEMDEPEAEKKGKKKAV